MTLDYNPRNASTQQNPYPVFAELRRQEPVFWSTHMKGWMVTRYDHARQVLGDADDFSNARIQPFLASLKEERRDEVAYLGHQLSKWAVFTDPPAHKRLRPVMMKGFVPAVPAMEPKIRAIIAGLIEKLAGRESFDVMADFAVPLPTLVITAMLGLPAVDAPRIKRWSDELAAFVAGSKMTGEKWAISTQAMRELSEYLDVVVDRREAEGATGDDVVSRLIAANQGAPEPLTKDELVQTCVLLTFAGHETTTDLIGNSMFHLIHHRDQMQQLVEQPALMESAVEEFLRFDNPALAIVRVAKRTLELDGKTIKEGQRVFVFLNAANRDPEKYPDPERLDIARKPKGMMSFGNGIHLCVGAPLARLEGRLALNALLGAYPNLEIAVPTIDLSWRDAYVVRGITSLPVRRR